MTATWGPPPQWWAVPPRPPHRHRPGHRFRWAIGVAVLALLVASGAAAGTVRKAKPPAPESLAAAVPGIEAFVAHDRQLRYLHPVKVIVESPAELRAFLAAQDGGGDSVAEAEDQTYQALGLIDSWQSYLRHEKVFESEDVVGLYIDGTDTIRIEATESDPYTRSVLAHELTHALDDQHFGLDKTENTALGEPDTNTDIEVDSNAFEGYPLPDVLTGVKGLIEGDAEHTRDDYLAQLSSADKAAERKEEDAAGGGIMADADDQTIFPLDYFPYAEGVTFVRALLAHGGEQAVDDALVNPPTTTAQILHPDQFFEYGDGGDSLSPPPETPPGTVSGSGRLGEAGLALVLYGGGKEFLTDGLAAGWREDTFITSTEGTKACVGWNIDVDSPARAGAIAALLRTRIPGAAVSTSEPSRTYGDGEVTLASCR